MGAAFRNFFAMFTALFSAGGKVAESLDILATSGLEMSHNHLDSARFERQKQQLELAAKIKALEVELAAPTAPLLVANKK